METQDPILLKLKEKETARAKALADAAELETQIEILRKTLEMIQPTEYEKYLKTRNVVASAPDDVSTPPIVAVMTSSEPKLVIDQSPQKNIRGTLTPMILSVMADGKTRTIDEALNDVNAHMSVPTTRDSIRATLGNLKHAGKISSPGYGKYQYPTGKGESPANVVATNDNGEAFNVQSSL